MPSNRETNSTSWRMASTVEWDMIRSAAGWAERSGRVGEAERLMAETLEALSSVSQSSPLVAEFVKARAGRSRAHARARARGSSGGRAAPW